MFSREFLLATSAHLALLLTFGAVAFVLTWESFASRRAIPNLPFVRYLNNFALAALDKGLGSFALPLFAMIPQLGPGLLTDVPWWIAAPVTAVSLELVEYWWHRLSHAVPVLWRLHLVHHTDTELDASTSVRHHPFEGLLGTLVLTPVVLLLKPDPLIVIGWNFLGIAISAFSHGNLAVPLLEKTLGRVIVTPGFHCVHHSAELPFTNSNYANNFPWMDDLFGTAKRWSEQDQTTRTLGLEYFRAARDKWLDRLLLEPFLKRK